MVRGCLFLDGSKCKFLAVSKLAISPYYKTHPKELALTYIKALT